MSLQLLQGDADDASRLVDGRAAAVRACAHRSQSNADWHAAESRHWEQFQRAPQGREAEESWD